jgi:hypothetical protein
VDELRVEKCSYILYSKLSVIVTKSLNKSEGVLTAGALQSSQYYSLTLEVLV